MSDITPEPDLTVLLRHLDEFHRVMLEEVSAGSSWQRAARREMLFRALTRQLELEMAAALRARR